VTVNSLHLIVCKKMRGREKHREAERGREKEAEREGGKERERKGVLRKCYSLKYIGKEWSVRMKERERQMDKGQIKIIDKMLKVLMA
jgi:hypothetical protein